MRSVIATAIFTLSLSSAYMVGRESAPRHQLISTDAGYFLVMPTKDTSRMFILERVVTDIAPQVIETRAAKR